MLLSPYMRLRFDAVISMDAARRLFHFEAYFTAMITSFRFFFAAMLPPAAAAAAAAYFAIRHTRVYAVVAPHGYAPPLFRRFAFDAADAATPAVTLFRCR